MMPPRLRPLGRAIPWTSCLVALGLGLRLYHYLRNPSMWHDEAALVLNVLSKGFGELLGPLFFYEAAPPLFLWAERAIALTLGEGTFALRLLPCAASCAALVLLVPVARRVLRPAAVPAAILLFACADNLLWHACEAKSYSIDILAATLLLAAFCCLEAWPLCRRLACLALLAPIVILLSYPGCFLYGGLLTAHLPAVWRQRDWRVWLSHGLLALAVFGSFTLLVLGPIQAQRGAPMTDCWLREFPQWQRPWTVPFWTFYSSVEVVRYCTTPGPVGQAMAALAVGGAVLLWRRGRRCLVVVLTLPIVLALLASYAWAYPYGGARVMAYAAPAVALLIAEAVPATWAWLRERSRWAAVALPAMLVVPLAHSTFRVVVPWQRADCAGASAFVMAHRQPGEAVTANHWEYAYYFRHLDAFTRWEDMTERREGRLWVVISGATPEQLTPLLHSVPPGDWQPLERYDFALTRVFLVQRPAPAQDTNGR
jgi:hypothetical protein